MKRRIFMTILAMGLLGACGKEEEVKEALAESVFDIQDYRMTISTRENSMVQADDYIDYQYDEDNEAVTYYGLYAGGTYFKKMLPETSPTVYINDAEYMGLWTHDECTIIFEDCDRALNEYFTSVHVGYAEKTGQAELSPQFGSDEDKILCDVYSMDSTADIRIWDPDEKYTSMKTEFYTYEDKMVYSILNLKNSDGQNMTITVNVSDQVIDFAVPDESAFCTVEEYKNTEAGYAMNDEGQTAMDIMAVSDNDIENEQLDGYYYADGTFTFDSPMNTQSWRRIENGEVTEEFDFEANKYKNYVTGETIDNVVTTTTYTDEEGNVITQKEYNNIHGDKVLGVGAQQISDVFNMSYCRIRSAAVSDLMNPPRKDYIYILGYADDRYDKLFMEANPDLITDDIKKLTEEIYNDWTLQQIIDRLESGKMTEEEKFIIAYFAHKRNMVITSTDRVNITFIDLLNRSGLDVEGYYKRYKGNEAPFLPVKSYLSGLAGPVNIPATDQTVSSASAPTSE